MVAREHEEPKLRNIFSLDSASRRRAVKALAYRVPGRPLWMFAYILLLRRGFLDGVPGLYYSAMRASYELMIDVKASEERWKRKLNGLERQ
jgi:hypothetical protein